jgi:hypothetical protein
LTSTTSPVTIRHLIVTDRHFRAVWRLSHPIGYESEVGRAVESRGAICRGTGLLRGRLGWGAGAHSSASGCGELRPGGGAHRAERVAGEAVAS